MLKGEEKRQGGILTAAPLANSQASIPAPAFKPFPPPKNQHPCKLDQEFVRSVVQNCLEKRDEDV